MKWVSDRTDNFQIEVGLANLAWGLVALAAVVWDWGVAALAAVTGVFGLGCPPESVPTQGQAGQDLKQYFAFRPTQPRGRSCRPRRSFLRRVGRPRPGTT